VARLGVLEGESEKIRRERDEIAGQIQTIQSASSTGALPARALAESGDPGIGKLSGALVDLSLERENLLVTLTPQHPQIRDLDARIASIRESLDTRVRAVRESLLRELRFKSQILEERAGDVQRQIQRVRQEQRALPEVAREYAQLQRELTQNENLLSTLRSKLQEVQIKEREQVEEVSLVRPATVPGSPMNPAQTAGKVFAGLLIGLTVGLVLAFVLESLDTSIGTIQDVESYLETPVLGLIPLIDPVRDPLLAPPEDEE
jgi:uncharacterized protein involved in exopolysaccharide biosynthesis